jgi:hypothetical protein
VGAAETLESVGQGENAGGGGSHMREW